MRALMVVGSLALLVVVPEVAAAAELDLLPLGDPERGPVLASAGPGTFYDCANGRETSLEEMVEAMAGARVVLLGEEHTSMEQKLVLARVVGELAERVPRLVLGMEFFQRSDRDALDRWRRREIAGEGFLRAVEWYDRGGYRYEYYEPIMTAALEHGLEVAGLNVAREIPRTVRMLGLAALSEEQRAEVGSVDVGGSSQHRYLISRYFGDTVAQLPPSWLDNMYAAQCLWDVVMARSILDALPEGGAVVVVVGSGHVAFDLGIARRIHEERAERGEPDLEVVTYCPVEALAPDPEGEPGGHPMGDSAGQADAVTNALFSRGLARFVGVFPASGGMVAVPSGLGLKLEADEHGAPQVVMVWPDSDAEGIGFKAGDRVLDVNGIAPEDLSHLRFLLASFDWGRRLDLRVQRGGNVLDLAVLLYPRVEETETGVAPGWKVEEVPLVIPDASGPLTELVGARVEPGPRRLLLRRDGAPERVEVWRGDVLSEVHELDEAARVARSLYLEPRADGSVELRYQRSECGEVVATSRYDRTGAKLEDSL